MHNGHSAFDLMQLFNIIKICVKSGKIVNVFITLEWVLCTFERINLALQLFHRVIHANKSFPSHENSRMSAVGRGQSQKAGPI